MPRDEVKWHYLECQIRLPHCVLDVAVAEDQLAQEQGRHQDDEDCAKRGEILSRCLHVLRA